MTDTRAVLLDIEGTTTPIDFVYTTLFPFARGRIADFLAGCDAGLLEAFQREHSADANGPPAWGGDDREGATAYATWLMDRDVKSTALKTAQGLIWEEGYASGELRGAVYRDVAPALRRWESDGVMAAIFSSGSVLAQKLLFRHSTEGDLTPLLTGYFDTTTGPKREADSYRCIAGHLRVGPGAVLFLSDVAAELDAAREAGMATRLVVRPGTAELAESGHDVIRDFDGVLAGA